MSILKINSLTKILKHFKPPSPVPLNPGHILAPKANPSQTNRQYQNPSKKQIPQCARNNLCLFKRIQVERTYMGSQVNVNFMGHIAHFLGIKFIWNILVNILEDYLSEDNYTESFKYEANLSSLHNYTCEIRNSLTKHINIQH